MLALDVVQHLLADLRRGVRDKLACLLGDQVQAVVLIVENRRQPIEVGGSEELLGFIALERPDSHLDLWEEIGHGVREHPLHDVG